MAKGGGGQSGAVSYPDYMEAIHEDWLDDCETLIDPYITGASPYDGTFAYDPSSELSDMQTAVDNVDTLVSGLDHESDWGGMADAAIAKQPIAFPGLDGKVSTISGIAKDFADDLVDGILSGNDIDTVVRNMFVLRESLFQSILAKVDGFQSLAETDASRFVDAIMSGNGWSDFVTAASGQTPTLFPSPNTDVNTIESLAETTANTVFETAKKGKDWTSIVSTISPALRSMMEVSRGDATSFAETNAESSISTGVTNLMALDSGVSAAIRSKVYSAIIEGIKIGMSSTVDSIVDEAADRFEDSMLDQHMRSVNRLSGQAVDLNAVNSSSFVMGMALLESRFQSTVNKFRADTKLAITGQTLTTYVQSMMQLLSTYITSGIQLSSSQLGLATQALQLEIAARTGIGAEAFRMYTADVSNRINLFLEAYSRRLSGYIQSEEAKDRFVVESIRQMSANIIEELKVKAEEKKSSIDQRLRGAGADLEATSQMLLGLTGQAIDLVKSEVSAKIGAYGERLRAGIESLLTDEKHKSLFIVQSAGEMANLLKFNSDLAKTAELMQIDVSKASIIANKEQTDRDVELDVMDAKWPFEVLMFGGNMLASIAGAAYTVDKPMSTAQSVLSGAVSGASAGAALGPWGAAIGGGIGAIAGFLS